jgi:16S rRNA (cytosine1402-N4)-methyltransferase
MLQETIDALRVREGGIYVDGTVGGAGHGEKICELLGSRGGFIGIDMDEEALRASKERLERFGNVELVHDNFANIDNILDSLGIEEIDGGVLDLGVSSYQLDRSERGFSYRADAPLDMRMDRNILKTAAEVVNNYTAAELTKILLECGEERYARQIARRIVEKRPINTTFELVKVIKGAVPPRVRYAEGKHPAKRAFQAIRIEVNGELKNISSAVDKFALRLKIGGRLAIITFHSLEDRIVKRKFIEIEGGKCVCPKGMPVCVCGANKRADKEFKVVTRKPVVPSGGEIEINPRSKSAKLRVIERVG